jgi:hypothetical protein
MLIRAACSFSDLQSAGFSVPSNQRRLTPSLTGVRQGLLTFTAAVPNVANWPDSVPLLSGRWWLKPPSVLPSPAHRRPRCRDIALYFPISCDQVAAVPLASFSCGGKLATLLFAAWCASRMPYRQARSTLSSDAPGGRIDASKDAANRECDSGTENRKATVSLT